MDVNEFREFAKATIDYIADYHENIRDKQVLPDISPGYIKDKVPSDPPKEGEHWGNLLKDVNDVILPGLTHWQSPNFYAYYPASYSFPSVVGDLLSTGLGCVGLNWITGPAITELEVVMMDWLGKMLDIPLAFLNCSEGPGGGIIKGTASEATLVCLLAAKDKTVRRVKTLRPDLCDSDIKGKLVAYSSDHSNSSIEKAGLIGSVPMRLLLSDDEGRLNPQFLKEAIEQDLKLGLFPCYVVATLGTTGTCSFDNLQEIGPICEEFNVWLHVDAAYAGAAFVCPEYRYLKNGLEYAESFNFNAHKFMLINFDCSILWVKNAFNLINAFTVERPYLKHEYDSAPEYMHWQIPLGRRFRALKLWFMIRTYGVEGIRKYIRKQTGLINYFSEILKKDSRFEVCCKNLALLCFRVRGDDNLTKMLLNKLYERKQIYVISYTYKKNTVIRFSINSNECSEADLHFAYTEISNQVDDILNKNFIVITKEVNFKIEFDKSMELENIH
ncbi:PREDICTED: alpha-methyldopa hypersensitive protein-like [Nicrophorus vespilloides]|uniref:Alpha-methyldopa hypersensitive protein-like n=1 Tax=Nicrophorus vespilloides TaxID=110193 RepID=A0ABM1MQM5_NICVS|nr:PREDICTED: alpha-methyldopa hypersensitive protein-like [Nicrophorus vespilloides]